MSSQKPRLGTASALVLLTILAGGEARLDAQAPVVWQFENVAQANLIPECVTGMTLAGFEFGPDGRPVLAWREENACGGKPRIHWTRRDAGQWTQHEFLSGRQYGGGAEGDYAHQLVLRPSDGTPFLIYADVGHNNSINTYRDDLSAYVAGIGSSTYLESLVGAAQCAGVTYGLAFGPLDSTPQWSTGLASCNGVGPVLLNAMTFGLSDNPRSSLAIGADGTRHLLWITGNKVYYTRWPAAAPAPDAAIQLITSNIANGGEAKIAIDAAGTLHALVRGPDVDADSDFGALAYLQSTDGGTTWSPWEYVDPRDNPAVYGPWNGHTDVSLVVDADGVPAVSYWRWHSELFYARRDGPGGTWTRQLVTSLPYSNPVSGRPNQLRFDPNGQPVIAFFDPVAGQVRLARPPPTNRPPVAVDEDVEVVAGTPTTIQVVANDTDPDGDPLEVDAIVTPPQHGAATITSASSISYDPSTYLGSDSFTYRVRDGHGGTATATVTLNVIVPAPPNRPPAFDVPADRIDVEGSAVRISLAPTDPDGDAVRLTVTPALPSGIEYSPSLGALTGVLGYEASGSHTISITAEDGRGGSTSGSFIWKVANTNRPPVANPDAATTDEDASVAIDPIANDTDADGDSPALAAVTTPVHGQVTFIVGGGAIKYDPPAHFSGVDTFSYTIDDGHGGTATAMVTVTVTHVNDAPQVVTPITQTGAEFDTVSLAIAASDADAGDTLTYSAANLPAGLTIDAAGLITGTLGVHSAGDHSVTITVSDGTAEVTAGFLWTVSNVVCNPIARPDVGTTFEDTAIDIDVLGNDIAPSSCGPIGFDLAGVSAAQNGTVTYDTKLRIVTYTPARDFHGVDHFTYTITNKDGGSATAAVTLTVAAVNDAPVPVNPGSQNSQEGGRPSVQLLATDADGDTLTFAASNLPPGLSISAAGLISGTLGTDSAGTYTVLVSVGDGAGQTSMSFTWNVAALLPVKISTLSLPAGAQGIAYQATLVATGGATPYEWRVVQGRLPAGLSLNRLTGQIAGTPSAGGRFNFVVQVEDALGATAKSRFRIQIRRTSG